jgi:hypothetical protein
MVMNPTLVFSVLTALGAAVWSVWTWREEQQKEREIERDRESALFVNSFMVSLEKLQAGLYGILEEDDLAFYKQKYPKQDEFGSPFAVEILYRFSRYFGWGHRAFRYGPYTNDPKLIELVSRIGGTFESRRKFPGEAFRFTFEDRVALGEAVVQSTGQMQGFIPEFESITLFKFQEAIRDQSGPYRQLFQTQAVRRTLAALDEAERPEALEGVERLAVLQNLLVDLLAYLEDMEGFSVSAGSRRRARLKGAAAAALPPLGAAARVVHQTPGRIRLRVPRLQIDATYAQQLQSLLETVDHVDDISIRVNAASVVVGFRPEIPETEFARKLAQAIETGFYAG